MVWLTGGALAVGLFMIIGLLVLVVVQGVTTFWPDDLVRFKTTSGDVRMGEITRSEIYSPEPGSIESLPPEALKIARQRLEESGGLAERHLVRTGNFDISGTHFHWVNDFEIEEETTPGWGLVLERLAWGRFYGFPTAFVINGEVVAEGPEATWEVFGKNHGHVRDRWHERRSIEKSDIGRLNHKLERSRLRVRQAELDHGTGSPEHRAAEEEDERFQQSLEAESKRIGAEITKLREENDRYVLRMEAADGTVADIPVAEIVRAYPANRVGTGSSIGLYLSRWWEYLTDDPREANSEGGVWPAIFGTVVMTLIMCILVVPFGVMAALYLREYAKAGLIVSTVRIAINNLAGVPSIVFGVFGLGFFCYIVGADIIDQNFYEANLPSPTFGKGGVLWASLTLALLTLPVVIVATEEALSAVPSSMREGSYACGASKWQTIRRIVMPRAMPGIMTGTILAMARGAGEVAPLMLVGAVKLAPELPIDGMFPFVHFDRSFMHLGFHIFDLGFQSQNSEAAKPMVYTTTLLLITIVVFLNVAAIFIRGRLRRRFEAGHF
ncbi:MAG: phosphate ABC transporter permease PstA [Planctomycetota bacterium]